MRTEERLPCDVFREQHFAPHQAEIASRPTPGFVSLLVDDMAQVIPPARMGRAACGQPAFPRLSPFPGACRETEYFCFEATAFQGARQYVGTDGGAADGPAAHATGLIDHQRYHRVPAILIASALVQKAIRSKAKRRVGKE